MRQNPKAAVTVFAVWEPMLPTDLRAPTTGTLARLSDSRVRQFYDANHMVAARMQADARPPQPEPDCCTRKGTLWDLAALYPSGAEWRDRMPTAIVFNGPVVDVIDSLKQALAKQDSSPGSELVFLTREGCMNSAKMRANLDAALQTMTRAGAYEIVDQDTLPHTDPRTGYPTPTLLYRNRDVFGMPQPRPPYPEPT